MTNADKFKNIFELYATELWSMPEKDFLKWLNSEAMNCSEIPNNSDTISRQAAIDVIDAVFPVDPMKSEYAQGIACGAALAKTYVEQLPSEQPERMKGKWERHYCEDGNPDGWRCDNCDEWYYFGQTLPNFCPNCGADMRGEQE